MAIIINPAIIHSLRLSCLNNDITPMLSVFSIFGKQNNLLRNKVLQYHYWYLWFLLKVLSLSPVYVP